MPGNVLDSGGHKGRMIGWPLPDILYSLVLGVVDKEKDNLQRHMRTYRDELGALRRAT